MTNLTRGADLKPGDKIRFGVPHAPWYGQIESLEPHGEFDGWQVAHFYNAKSVSIEPDGLFGVKRAGEQP